MKTYHVFITDDAKADLRRYTDYLKKIKNSPQAAKNIASDFRETRKKLENVAGILTEPASDVLKSKGLKRINFLKHDYFMLYRIEGKNAFITNIFHALEDFENKLG